MGKFVGRIFDWTVDHEGAALAIVILTATAVALYMFRGLWCRLIGLAWCS